MVDKSECIFFAIFQINMYIFHLRNHKILRHMMNNTYTLSTFLVLSSIQSPSLLEIKMHALSNILHTYYITNKYRLWMEIYLGVIGVKCVHHDRCMQNDRFNQLNRATQVSIKSLIRSVASITCLIHRAMFMTSWLKHLYFRCNLYYFVLFFMQFVLFLILCMTIYLIGCHYIFLGDQMLQINCFLFMGLVTMFVFVFKIRIPTLV